jgi:parallel beta-helix repeat protein
VAALVVSTWASRADAAVIRVATSGSDVGGCGTEAAPCRTLQYALDAASSSDEIRVAAGTYTGVSASGGHTQLAWIRDKHVAVRGGFTTSNWTNPDPEANPTVLDAQGLGMVLYISYSSMGVGYITVEGLRITGGNATPALSGEDEGGGIRIDHTTLTHVVVDTCRVYGNAADDGAGGIFSVHSPGLQVISSVIDDNTGYGIRTQLIDHVTVTDSTVTNHPGAGIKVNTGSITITGNTVTGNSPGIFLSSVDGIISGNTISGNSTTSEGGGITINGASDLTISNNSFFNNSGTSGGALHLDGANATVENNIAVSNSAPYGGYTGGGGFYLNAASTGYIEAIDNTLDGNSTVNQGGGMVLLGHVDASGNVLTNNTATAGGGAVASMMGTLEDNRFIGNSAQIGGGLSLINPMGVSLVRNLFRDNHATNGDGGGAYLWGGFFFDAPLLDGNRFIDNTASDDGGGLYLESQITASETTVVNQLVQGNTAEDAGSGMYLMGGTTEMAHCTFVGNVDDLGNGVGLHSRLFASSGDVTMTNCIVAGQETGIHVESGSVTIDTMLWGSDRWANTSDWTGSGLVATNETWGNPRFVGTGGEGYHLDGTSAARDAGADVGVLVDMDGEARPNPDTMIPDLGADEWSDRFDIFSDGFESGGTGAWS